MQNEPMPVRILFHFYSNVLDEWTNETLWANKVPGSDNHYTIDNIPFFAPVTIGDIGNDYPFRQFNGTGTNTRHQYRNKRDPGKV